MERIIGLLISGFGCRAIAAGAAVYVVSYAAIALCDAMERIGAALPG